MAIPTLKNIQDLGELKQNFRWDIDFKQLNPVIAISTKDKLKNISLMCESTELPRKDVEWTPVNIRGMQIKVAGTANTSGEITFTFVDNVENWVIDMITQWGNAVFNTKKSGFLANANANLWGRTNTKHKCDIDITRLNSARKAIKHYTLVGCGYLSFDPGGTLSSSDSEINKPSLTISYDAWYDNDDKV